MHLPEMLQSYEDRTPTSNRCRTGDALRYTDADENRRCFEGAGEEFEGDLPSEPHPILSALAPCKVEARQQLD